MPQSNKPRVSLTKTQRQAGVGAELLSLCQSVTEDGSLSNDEIAALKEWLDDNRSSDLPAIEFLTATVDRIIADGNVTRAERTELYKAIEVVLPPEARRAAAEQRRAGAAEDWIRDRNEGELQKQRDRELKDRQRPLRAANFMVAGVRYEGRPEIIREYVDEGDTVFLARDRKNKYSRNAVEVRLRNGFQIGYVPEDDVVDIAPLLDQGCPHNALVTKMLTGGRSPIPVVEAYVYRQDAGVEGAVLERDVPQKRVYSHAGTPQAKGCLSMVLLALISIMVAVVATVRVLASH